MKETVTAISIIAILASCNPCEDREPPLNTLSPTEISYGSFKPGTYWVYQNDSTMVLDSICITHHEKDTVENADGTCRDGSLEVTSYNETIYSYLSPNFEGKSLYYRVEPMQVLLADANYGGQLRLYSDITTSDPSYFEYHPVYEVSGVLYENVFSSTTPHSWLEDGDDVTCFIAAGYGLIKKQLFLEGGYVQSWSLIRYTIVQ